MNEKGASVLRELLSGLLGWVWLLAGIYAIYAFVRAVFFDGPWYSFFFGFGACIFSSGLARLIMNQGHNPGSVTRGEISQALRHAQGVVLAYSDILEQRAVRHATGIVSSIKELPCSKDEIKLALKLTLTEAIHNNNQNLIEGIKTAYVLLASFQDVAPEDMEALEAHQSVVSMGSSLKTTSGPDVVEVAKSLSSSLPTVIKYTDMMNKESAQLLKEIEEA